MTATGLSICKFFKKFKNECSPTFRGLAFPKRKEKYFREKIWIVIAPHFLDISKKPHSIAFKRVVIDCEKMNGLVDSDETVIEKMLDTNQWCYHRKVLM